METQAKWRVVKFADYNRELKRIWPFAREKSALAKFKKEIPLLESGELVQLEDGFSERPREGVGLEGKQLISVWHEGLALDTVEKPRLHPGHKVH